MLFFPAYPGLFHYIYFSFSHTHTYALVAVKHFYNFSYFNTAVPESSTSPVINLQCDHIILQ